jgi:ABC-2 type transport system ATP-binding protein
VILSSHILPEVQATCERVIVINKGKIIADGTPDNLSKAMSTDHKLTARIEGPEDSVYDLLKKLPKMLHVDKLGEREPGVYDYTLEAETGTDVRRELFSRLSQRNWPLLGLRGSELSLEDIFLQLTDDSSDYPAIVAEETEILEDETKGGDEE